MTARQYRATLEQLGLNQQEAGRWLGVSRRTAQNWAANGPPEPVARLLALVIHQARNPGSIGTLMERIR